MGDFVSHSGMGTVVASLWLCAVPSNTGAAEMPPDYGYQWSTITGPGNRGVMAGETIFGDPQFGRVDHVYRMARTEVTNGQWLEYVQAYGNFYLADNGGNGVGASKGFTGTGITYVIGGGWALKPGVDPNSPAVMNWEHAARYCNWLTNNKQPQREAFENGAYDTSTFTVNPDGSYNHQSAHNPDAAFWIPTVNEWTKATYWDPAKVGPDGQLGAYWRYPYSSNTVPLAAPPDQGGQTNRGGAGPNVVGSYPLLGTPWGLLDSSGGIAEFTETKAGTNASRNTGGSSWGHDFGSATYDRLGITSSSFVTTSFPTAVGLRLASFVPSPGGGVAFGGGICLLIRRSRRDDAAQKAGGNRRSRAPRSHCAG